MLLLIKHSFIVLRGLLILGFSITIASQVNGRDLVVITGYPYDLAFKWQKEAFKRQSEAYNLSKLQ